MTIPLEKHLGQLTVLDILGDVEAYVFDFSALPEAKQAELIAHHLAAFDARKRQEGKADWATGFVPFALLGESMPPKVRARVDLSAPHEGVLLRHAKTGAIVYAASKSDAKLAIVAEDEDGLNARESFLRDTFDAQAFSYAYEVDRSESEGFTLGQIETMMSVAGGELTMV